MHRTSKGLAAILFLVGVSGARVTAAQSTPYTLDRTDSTITFTHTADSANSGSTVNSLQLTGTSGNNTIGTTPTTPARFNDTINTQGPFGQSSTTAVGDAYQIRTATNLGVSIQSGSGVTQTNVPGKAYTGASVLDTNVNLVWNLTSQFAPAGQFPGINYSFPVGGTVGIGGSDEFIVALQFSEYRAGDDVVTPIGSLNIDYTYTNSTSAPAQFTQLFSGNDALNGGNPVVAGEEFIITGDIKFRAKNDESPSNFDMTADSSFGAAPSLTAPTGAQDFTDTETVAVPEPRSFAMGILAMVMLAVGSRSQFGRLRKAASRA